MQVLDLEHPGLRRPVITALGHLLLIATTAECPVTSTGQGDDADSPGPPTRPENRR